MSLVSPWLLDLWTCAEAEHRQAVWRSLPTKVLEAFSLDRRFFLEDVAWLGTLAVDQGTARHPSQAALGILAAAVEDGHAPIEWVRPYVLEALRSPRAGVRSDAVEALWQMADRSTVPALRVALSQETHMDVAATITHVLKIFSVDPSL